MDEVFFGMRYGLTLIAADQNTMHRCILENDIKFTFLFTALQMNEGQTVLLSYPQANLFTYLFKNFIIALWLISYFPLRPPGGKFLSLSQAIEIIKNSQQTIHAKDRRKIKKKLKKGKGVV